ncbi:MAG TPA: DUF4386 domain-containing protein [Candidatus Binatia bacterium]|nr:DUF4386 domain-containing protein [Candidatus Binatia bacterium]
MMERIVDASPRRLARAAGALYLLTLLTGFIAQFLISARLVTPDASTTAANLAAHRQAFEWGFTVYLIEMACQIAMTALFYNLLEPVSRSLSLLTAALGLVGCTIKTLGRIFYLAPMLVLTPGSASGAFPREQLQALAQLSLQANDLAAGTALAFFGFAALVKGYLIIRSTFLPRVLGMLSIVAGVAWLTFLSPALGNRAFPIIMPLGLLAAGAHILWLLVVGVNEPRWREQASAAGVRLS